MLPRSADPAHRGTGLGVLVTGTASDAHTWNLIYLQCLLEERGHRVVNIGPCVPDTLLATRCRDETPDLVVISSVNGHGFTDAVSAVEHLAGEPDLSGIPVVVGGKLGTDGTADPERVARLYAAGAAAVFADGDLTRFDQFLTALARSADPVAS